MKQAAKVGLIFLAFSSGEIEFLWLPFSFKNLHQSWGATSLLQLEELLKQVDPNCCNTMQERDHTLAFSLKKVARWLWYIILLLSCLPMNIYIYIYINIFILVAFLQFLSILGNCLYWSVIMVGFQFRCFLLMVDTPELWWHEARIFSRENTPEIHQTPHYLWQIQMLF